MSKNFKKNTWIALAIAAAVLLTVMGVYATRSKAMTLDDAKALAQKELPQSAEYVGGSESENKFRTLFYDKENNGKYKVEVSKKTGKVKKIEAEMYDGSGDFGGSGKLSKEDIEKIIREKFKGIQSIYIESDTDDGRLEYEVKFKGDGFYGEAGINPETGAILDYSLKFGAAVTIPKSSGGSGKEMLTKEQAVKAALEASGGGFVEDFDIERWRGKYYYEVDVIKDNKEINYLIDPETGEVTVESACEKFFNGHKGKPAQKSNEDAYISADAAKDIVLKKIPEARIHDFGRDREHGRNIYEGEAVSGGYEYEFEIDAASGVILQWEKEPIKHDDDRYDDDRYDDDRYDDDRYDDDRYDDDRYDDDRYDDDRYDDDRYDDDRYDDDEYDGDEYDD